MENNLISVLIVPEVSLAILAIACLMYGLFSKKDSFNKSTNLIIIINTTEKGAFAPFSLTNP